MTGLSEALVASLIAGMGLVALAFGAARWRSGDRAAVWFGVFGCLYGVRLAGYSVLVQPALPEPFWRYLDAFITYAIVVPVGLFVESLFGHGWRSLLRRVWQAAAVYAMVAMVHDLVRGVPGATLWLNAPVVLIAGSIATGHVVARWWRGAWPRELRVAATGGLVFVAVATYQTLGGTTRLEHFAMLVFMVSVGYLVVQRMLAGERELVAVSRELDIARRIQQSILPRRLPEVAGLGVAASYMPMSAVGGDFYDFNTDQPERLGVIVADASGHGVPAALVASMVKIAFAAEAERLDDPGQVLTNINRRLSGTFQGAYVTACCAFVDARTRTLTYASAGHPAPLLRRAGGHVEHLDERGLLLAFDPDARYGAAQAALQPGDRVVFFSDGLIEACNASDEFFGDARLEQLVAASGTDTPGQLVEALVGDLRRWVGPTASLQDDVTLVVVDLRHRAPLERP